MSFFPEKYDPARCHADVPKKTRMLRWRQCKRSIPPNGGYGPNGNLCYQHGAILESKSAPIGEGKRNALCV